MKIETDETQAQRYAARAAHILDAAAMVLMQFGYDKTTMHDIADAAAVTRAILYQHFGNKNVLLESLLRRETVLYIQVWLAHIEADPRGGTIGSTYRAVMAALDKRQFIAAIIRQDQKVMGKYLRKSRTLFVPLQSMLTGAQLLQSMQEIGAVRRDADVNTVGHILDMLSYGLASADAVKVSGELPPLEKTMETLAAMMDAFLTPDDVDHARGKALMRHIAAQAIAIAAPTGDPSVAPFGDQGEV